MGATFTLVLFRFLEVATQELTELNKEEYIKRTCWFIFLGSITFSTLVIPW